MTFYAVRRLALTLALELPQTLRELQAAEPLRSDARGEVSTNFLTRTSVSKRDAGRLERRSPRVVCS